MKKLHNQVDAILRESLMGLGAVHGDLLQVSLEPMLVTRSNPKDPDKVVLSDPALKVEKQLRTVLVRNTTPYHIRYS